VGQAIAFCGLSSVVMANGRPRDGQTTNYDRLSHGARVPQASPSSS